MIVFACLNVKVTQAGLVGKDWAYFEELSCTGPLVFSLSPTKRNQKYLVHATFSHFIWFRSSYDEYTPADQVEYIQSSLLRILSSFYGENIVTNKCY